MLGLNDEILTYLLLIFVGYIIAKMFSRCEGFSVGGRNLCTDPGGPENMKNNTKTMGVTITDRDKDTCITEAETCVSPDVAIIGWSQTDAPDCTSNSCGPIKHWFGDSDNTPTEQYYRNTENTDPEKQYNVSIHDYDGAWSDTGQNSDNLYTLTSHDIEDICHYNSDKNEDVPFSGCAIGNRALCGYKINSKPNNGQGGKCEGVKYGIPGYCKKNQYCCNGECCSNPCDSKGINICTV